MAVSLYSLDNKKWDLKKIILHTYGNGCFSTNFYVTDYKKLTI